MPTTVTFQIPDDVAQSLCIEGKELRQAALEAVALEGYRAGKLSEFQVGQILGLPTRDHVDGFLKEHGAWLNYSLDDLEQERAVLRKLGYGD
ncbi:MAG: UPF0175 family protein [Bryobacteraceae bacterium]